MKITLLNENTTSKTNNKLCASEWGISALVEINGITILFDTGHSDIYWKNAEKIRYRLK